MTFLDRHTGRVLATIFAFAFALWLLRSRRELFFLLAYPVEPIIAAIYRHSSSLIASSSLLSLPTPLEPFRREIMHLGSRLARVSVNLFAARFGRSILLTGLLDELHAHSSSYIRALFVQSLSVLLTYLVIYQPIAFPFVLLLAALASIVKAMPLLNCLSARELLGGVRGIFLSMPVLATLHAFCCYTLRRGALLLCLTAASLSAHSISVSNSEAAIDGSALTLKLRIPRYEAEHVPAAGLTSAFHFAGAQLASSSCAPQEQEILCDLRFAFPAPPAEQLEAQITLARVTVPNHVHILRISRGPVTRQIVFDRTFEKERINFHEPGRIEVFWRAARMGFVQLLYQPVLLVLLLILPRPLAYSAALAAAFLVVLPDRFYASPGFFELATAISLTYLACEHLLFREASGKWLISAAIGLLEGAALAVLARPTGSGAVAFGAGNLVATLALSLSARYFAHRIPLLLERYLYWAFAALGILWTIWVFFNRF
jgi:hypothetical protein